MSYGVSEYGRSGIESDETGYGNRSEYGNPKEAHGPEYGHGWKSHDDDEHKSGYGSSYGKSDYDEKVRDTGLVTEKIVLMTLMCTGPVDMGPKS